MGRRVAGPELPEPRDEKIFRSMEGWIRVDREDLDVGRRRLMKGRATCWQLQLRYMAPHEASGNAVVQLLSSAVDVVYDPEGPSTQYLRFPALKTLTLNGC